MHRPLPLLGQQEHRVGDGHGAHVWNATPHDQLRTPRHPPWSRWRPTTRLPTPPACSVSTRCRRWSSPTGCAGRHPDRARHRARRRRRRRPGDDAGAGAHVVEPGHGPGRCRPRRGHRVDGQARHPPRTHRRRRGGGRDGLAARPAARAGRGAAAGEPVDRLRRHRRRRPLQGSVLRRAAAGRPRGRDAARSTRSVRPSCGGWS